MTGWGAAAAVSSQLKTQVACGWWEQQKACCRFTWLFVVERFWETVPLVTFHALHQKQQYHPQVASKLANTKGICRLEIEGLWGHPLTADFWNLRKYNIQQVHLLFTDICWSCEGPVWLLAGQKVRIALSKSCLNWLQLISKTISCCSLGTRNGQRICFYSNYPCPTHCWSPELAVFSQ